MIMNTLLDALPLPVIELDREDHIIAANSAAEQFFGAGRGRLKAQTLREILPVGSPLIGLSWLVREKGRSITEYGLDLSPGKQTIGEQVADIYAAPLPGTDQHLVLMIQPRAIMDKMNRQLSHRDAARSVGAMASMLAHEIKNPLSGIRGAAQLLESSVSEADRPLSQLIRSEVDRIVRLVERFEIFSDGRPLPMAPVNLHEVLDHVQRLASSGFARHIAFEKRFDPSLPPILGHRDQLVQTLLNLVKNAAEAIGETRMDGQILLTTGFRAGVSVLIPTSGQRIGLPFEVCISDNGPGVPEHLLPHLFEPFVSSKANGTGLGLALVAKVVSDHGGVIESERLKGRTIFRVLLPIHQPNAR
jgi:two-component system, NtrC family, nitrogen regulation sensor histidine kinase GlnL